MVLRTSQSEICYQIFLKLLINFSTPFLDERRDAGYNSKSKFEHRPDLINTNSESTQFRHKYQCNYFTVNLLCRYTSIAFFILGVRYKKCTQRNSTITTKRNVYVSLIKPGSDDFAKPQTRKNPCKMFLLLNQIRGEQKR